MNYEQRKPHPALAPYVECYWSVRAEDGGSLILPDGCSDLIFKRWADGKTECHYIGFQTKARPIERPQACEYYGVRFKGFGAAPLLGQQVHELIDEAVLTDDLQLPFPHARGPQDFWSTCEERLLAARKEAEVKAVVVAATEILQHSRANLPVAQLAKHLGVSRQYLTRMFKKFVGVSPNKYSRVMRTVEATRPLRRLCKPDWSSVALDLGFYDQSHFIASFKEVVGVTPETYRLGANGLL